MNSEKVIKLKRQIGRLSIEEVGELKKYIYTTFKKKSQQRYQERKLANYKRLRALDPGTLVVVEDSRFELAGKVGIIERHLGRGSKKTAVRFKETNQTWLIPTLYLSDDLSEMNANRIQQNVKLGKVFNKILNRTKLG